MIKSLAFKNSIFSVFQNLALSLASLVLLKVMITVVGLSQTSIWIYLSSITAITGFGSFGFANALTFFVPKYRVTKSGQDINGLISTCLLSTLFLTLLLSAICFVVFYHLIPGVFKGEMVGIAHQMLPLVLLSFLLSGIGSVFLSVLDGLSLMHIRSKLSMASTLLFVVAGIVLVKYFGITGIAYAQLLQNALVIILAACYVKKHLPTYRFSAVFSKAEFKRTFLYGFNFQIISITQIISDPYMKTMIIKFAGAEMLAFFDLCLKILAAIRGLLAAANQTITPGITAYSFSERNKRINVLFKSNYIIIGIFSVFLFLVPVCLSNVISLLFFNKVIPDILYLMAILALALFVNVLSLPAFYSFLGKGKLKWNVMSNVIAASGMFLFAPLIGHFFPGSAIALSWALPTIAGALFLLFRYKKENHIANRFFINKDLVLVFSSGILVVATVYLLNYLFLHGDISKTLLLAGSILIPLLVSGTLLYSNKTIRKILKRLKYGS